MKKHYEGSRSEKERQKQKEFQEKVVKTTMSRMSDDEFWAMIQEQSIDLSWMEDAM